MKKPCPKLARLRVAACALAILGMAAFAADPYPNPAEITRFLDADTDVTVPGVVNNGAIYKRGAGTATLTAPALNGNGTLNVAEGDVVLNLDAAPTVPTLPAYLQNKIKLWLDPGVNLETEGDLVTKWHDCRETAANISAGTPALPYATSEFHWWTAATGDRRPSLVSGGTALNGNYLDFGAYGQDSCKWLCITNTGAALGNINAREIFAIFARRAGATRAGFTMFSYCNGTSGSPYWAGDVNGGGYLWGSTGNTRADKGSTRLDRNAVWGGRLPIQDYAWHMLSTRVPTDTAFNQIGLDRHLAAYSGGFCLAEVIVCESRLSEFDRMRIEDYLWKKWMGARQTSVGSLVIGDGSTVSAATSSDVTGALSGNGTFVKSGTGTATLVDDGFRGTFELASGAIRTEGLPLAIKATGQRLGAGAQGVVTRTDDADAGVVEKYGSGQLVAASLPASAKVKVTTSRLTLSPPVAAPADFLDAADFPNAGFEGFGVANSQNVGGGSGTATPQVYGNWTFDRVDRSGGNLLLVLNKDANYNKGSFNILANDQNGIGYEGTNYVYLCRGDATGEFTIPAPGMYRLVFNVGGRSIAFCLRPITLKIDNTEVRTITSFYASSWMRYEVALPFLSAGTHTVTFSDEIDPNCGLVILFDDIKILPAEARSAAPAAVTIKNPGFEESWDNVANTGLNFLPSAANCTDWTMQGITSVFAKDMVLRRWFDDVTGASYGILAHPDEMAEGFLCAQLYGAERPVSQTISLPSAGRYRLSFSLAKRSCFNPQLVTVKIGSKVVKKVWVRHDDWRRYEAIFDMDAAGSYDLRFEGGAPTQSGIEYTSGSALLDDIAMERVSDIPTGNIVVNGDFEGEGGWTFHAAAAPASTAALWISGVTNAPPMGADCAVLGGTGAADSAIRQQVAFPAAGRYELSFRVKRYRTNPFGDDGKPSIFYVDIAGDRIWYSNLLRHEDECVVTQPFTVAEAGTKQLEFHLSMDVASRGMALVDDISIVAASAVDRTDLATYIPADTTFELASNTTLNLDFDGEAKVAEVSYGGHKVYGEISRATCGWVMGRGRLFTAAPGTVLVFR